MNEPPLDARPPEDAPREAPRVFLPDDASDFDATPVAEHTPPPSVLRSVIWASGLGLIGAIVWAAITLITDYQLGLIAVVLGVLAGFGAAKGGRGRPAQIVGALAAAGSYFVGQFIIIIAMVAGQSGDLPGEAEGLDAVPSEAAQVAQDGAPTPRPGAAPDTVAAAATADAPAELPEEDLGAGGLVFAILVAFVMVVQATVTDAMSLLFLGFAIYEGWRIPRAEDAV